MQTAERISSHDGSDNVIYQRHLVAYHTAANLVNGQLLEVGCGEGYGIPLLADKVQTYHALDKFKTNLNNWTTQFKHLHFTQASVPPLPYPSNEFDSLVSFQVIEHIENDAEFVKELARVLKPGGVLVLTTPNRPMSLTRNPWHVREYTHTELTQLLQTHFSKVDMQGVYGNEKVMQYYEDNKKSVRKFPRFDIFNLQYKLPRQLLQIPYDILNRFNRQKLKKGNPNLVNDIQVGDYHLKNADKNCFDLLAIAHK